MNLFLMVLCITFFSFSRASGDVEATLKEMTIDEKIGQLFMIDIRSSFLTIYDEDYQRAMQAIERYHIGGFILFNGATVATPVQLNEFQEKSKYPLLISCDLERGLFQNFPDGVQFPPNMAIAATGDSDNAYDQGKITAKEARALGIHMILAPVLDINNNPKNPIINFRSYGENPELVADMGAEMIEGLQDHGVIATAKHFPGHGDTSQDSHSKLPILNLDKPRLNSLELVPFRRAIDENIKAIMTAHIAIPSLNNGDTIPATLSKPILQGLLRKELGFRGLIISDAFNMDGISQTKSSNEAIIDAINAGVDIILMPKDIHAAIRVVKRALENGQLSENRINKSVRRILSAKHDLGLFKNRLVSVSILKNLLEQPDDIDASVSMARKSISFYDGRSERILYPAPYRIVNLSVSSEESMENPGKTFYNRLRQHYPNTTRLVIDHRTHPSQIQEFQNAIDSADQIILSLFSRTRAHKNSTGIDSIQQVFVKRLLNGAEQKTISVSFGSPYIASDFSYIRTHIAAYSYSQLMQESAADGFGGLFRIAGKIPVGIPKITTNVQNEPFAQLDLIMNKAIHDRVFPGASIAIGNSKGIVYQNVYGKFTYHPSSPKVRLETMYDLASLTKIVATTSAIMKLIDDKKLQLNTRLGELFDAYRYSEKDSITIGQLLTHSSGMLWHKRFYETSNSKQDVYDLIASEPLLSKPGKQTKYSDLGFITLMNVIETVSKQPFENFVAEHIFEPLGLKSITFTPEYRSRKKIPPTENGFYHKTLAQGIVHDGNAASIGGVSGHAGLFSNTSDLATFCQLFLNNGLQNKKPIFSEEIIRQFTMCANVDSTSVRGFGFDKPSPISLAGKYISDDAYGHTGFTGTSFWIDPKHDIYIILLSNRVYPSRENKRIGTFRPKFHDTVMEALGITTERVSYKAAIADHTTQ